MSATLRDLLIERGARLQGRPALTAPVWGTLSYGQLRQRVEGIALGLLAAPLPPALFVATGTAWDWAAELATAAVGRIWDLSGEPIPPEVLGGARFNHEAGRGPYHALEQQLDGTSPFRPGLNHGQWLSSLRRWNDRQGWDHDTELILPLADMGDPALRAALWCALFAGAHATLAPPPLRGPAWEAALFKDLL